VAPTWLPYELHPEIPREGIPRDRYFPPERLRAMAERMQAMAKEVGLVMKPRDRMVNTRLALSAAEYARESGAFDTVHRALFKLHWEGEGSLDDQRDLNRVVAEAGLEPSELEARLAEGHYEKLLDERREEAVSVGINAIPAHVFGQRFLVLGAQPIELFRQVLRKLAEQV
jgi:predicted DsbA family dithiol-disulfide isomerase